jgi:hypothetical protein
MSSPELKPVTSSALDAVGYDPASRELHVQYKGGGLYVFHDVAPELHAQLGETKSPGGFLNAEIKPKHRSTKQ